MLQDGAGSTRQLVDEEGAVNLSVSYTPCPYRMLREGDTMEIYGSGMLNLGYLGGVYDAGTGLIYMGNGQYYDPSTGRFLTRGNNNVNTNPYSQSSSDPAGMLIAPLALLALVFGRKKNKTKFEQFIILFMIFTSIWFITASFRFQASTNIATTQFLVTPKSQTVDIYDSGTVNNKYLLYIVTPYQSINSTYEINCSEHNFPKPTNEIDQYEDFWDYFEFRNIPERKERVIKLGLIAVARAFEREIGGDGADLFIRIFNLNLSQKMLFRADACDICCGTMAYTLSSREIEFNINKLYYSTSILEYNDDGTPKRWGVTPALGEALDVHNVIHELGHAFAGLFGSKEKSSPYSKSYPSSQFLWNYGFSSGPAYGSYLWRQHPMVKDESLYIELEDKDLELERQLKVAAIEREAHHEAFADMFLSWVYAGAGFTNDPIGRAREEYMDVNMKKWILRKLIERSLVNDHETFYYYEPNVEYDDLIDYLEYNDVNWYEQTY